MPKKPLKISWRNWCLYKLAKRDYSAFEMGQLIQKRAKDSKQEVDPDPVVEKLVDDGLIDDDRYIKSQISIHTQSNNIKGPKQIRMKLKHKGGIPADLLDQYIDEMDPKWFQLAKKCFLKTLPEKIESETSPICISIKEIQKSKQKLYQKGFTASQIDFALKGVLVEKEDSKEFDSEEIKRWISRRMSDGKGPMDIKHFLKGKGVSEDVIKQTLNMDDEMWVDIARKALNKRFDLNKKSSKKDKRKQMDFLLRRGFLSYQAQEAFVTE